MKNIDIYNDVITKLDYIMPKQNIEWTISKIKSGLDQVSAEESGYSKATVGNIVAATIFLALSITNPLLYPVSTLNGLAAGVGIKNAHSRKMQKEILSDLLEKLYILKNNTELSNDQLEIFLKQYDEKLKNR